MTKDEMKIQLLAIYNSFQPDELLTRREWIAKRGVRIACYALGLIPHIIAVNPRKGDIFMIDQATIQIDAYMDEIED